MTKLVVKLPKGGTAGLDATGAQLHQIRRGARVLVVAACELEKVVEDWSTGAREAVVSLVQFEMVRAGDLLYATALMTSAQAARKGGGTAGAAVGPAEQDLAEAAASTDSPTGPSADELAAAAAFWQGEGFHMDVDTGVLYMERPEDDEDEDDADDGDAEEAASDAEEGEARDDAEEAASDAEGEPGGVVHHLDFSDPGGASPDGPDPDEAA